MLGLVDVNCAAVVSDYIAVPSLDVSRKGALLATRKKQQVEEHTHGSLTDPLSRDAHTINFIAKILLKSFKRLL